MFNVPYWKYSVDPKSYDNTKQEKTKYVATSNKIALELFYLFKNLINIIRNS